MRQAQSLLSRIESVPRRELYFFALYRLLEAGILAALMFSPLGAVLGQPRHAELGTAVAAHVDPAMFRMDPIAASEAMAAPDDGPSLMPLGYGYVSYAMDGFRPHRLQFGNIPVADHAGSALGGTGIAVSAFSQSIEAARDYAYWVASPEVQASLYAQSGGQPGHAAGWESAAVNAATHDFYTGTRLTLERAYVRPRHHGYMAFQDAASQRITAGLQGREAPAAILADLERLYAGSF